jgi:hypothetical protein
MLFQNFSFGTTFINYHCKERIMSEQNVNTEQELLAAFTVMDVMYKNGVLRYIPGDAAGGTLDISSGAIGDPVTAVGVPSVAIGADDDPDPVLFTFTVPGPTLNSDPEVRILLVKISTPVPGQPSGTARYSVLNPHNPPSGTWETIARDVHLKYNNADAVGNPHAVAQAGDTLYIIEYDTQKIWSLGVHDLDGKITTPDVVATCSLAAPINLGPGSDADLPADAKGQALIYLENGSDKYLFALYQVPDALDPTGYVASVLVRLKKNATSGLFEYDDDTVVGLNAQSIIPVSYTPEDAEEALTMLLIPAIGGRQQAGSTNGANSDIYKAAPFAGTFSADVVLTGDPMPAQGAPTTFDIAAIAAQAANNGVVYILTFTFDTGWTALYWKLYRTTADALLGLSGSPTLSSLEGGVLIKKDGNPSDGPTPGIDVYGGLNYWDILYENGTTAAADRLWFRKNGVLINDAQSYGGSPRTFATGLELGQIGGDNINSFDLVAEVIRQAKAGVSLKRGFKSVKSQGAPEAEVEEEK